LLEAWPTLPRVAEAVANSGVSVTVVQAAASNAEFTRDRVDYRFVACRRPGRIGRKLMSFARQGAVGTAVATARPDVIHFHGLTLSGCLASVRRAAWSAPIVVQDHAGRVLRFWERPLARRALGAVDGVMFTSRAQAEPWLEHGVLPRGVPLFEVCESSSSFTPGDLGAARAATGLYGDPCLLWVGRLNRNKDPLMALEAVRLALRDLPSLHFWCFYTEAPLLGDVRARIAADRMLSDRVHLMGSVPHEDVEQLCRAADLFLSGSHSEGSGYALIEALASGVTPIVTDIPAFRAITGEGTVGALVSRADSEAMARSLVELAALDRAELRQKARAHFERSLSFNVLGQRLREVYETVMSQR
jgi:glycosyltransferase involved in cell wall biosynthesis